MFGRVLHCRRASSRKLKSQLKGMYCQTFSQTPSPWEKPLCLDAICSIPCQTLPNACIGPAHMHASACAASRLRLGAPPVGRAPLLRNRPQYLLAICGWAAMSVLSTRSRIRFCTFSGSMSCVRSLRQSAPSVHLEPSPVASAEALGT
eukprot:6195854-Pleurochrysis_carterae.AAC.2